MDDMQKTASPERTGSTRTIVLVCVCALISLAIWATLVSRFMLSTSGKEMSHELVLPTVRGDVSRTAGRLRFEVDVCVTSTSAKVIKYLRASSEEGATGQVTWQITELLAAQPDDHLLADNRNNYISELVKELINKKLVKDAVEGQVDDVYFPRFELIRINKPEPDSRQLTITNLNGRLGSPPRRYEFSMDICITTSSPEILAYLKENNVKTAEGLPGRISCLIMETLAKLSAEELEAKSCRDVIANKIEDTVNEKLRSGGIIGKVDRVYFPRFELEGKLEQPDSGNIPDGDPKKLR